MIDDAAWPNLDDDMVRVRFTRGHLAGAVLDLPANLAETAPGRLVITAFGVCDRDDDYRAVRTARILRTPHSTRPVHTLVTHPEYV